MDGSPALHAPHDVLRQRLDDCDNPRLAAIVGDLVEACSSVIAEHRVTRDELRALASFATEVGLATDERRNEWILLLDVTGLTLATENAARDRPAGSTPQTLLGPFYRAHAPAKSQGDTLSIDGIGRPLTFSARVVDLDGQPVTEAAVEVWHANGAGKFENQDPDSQPEFNLRGRFRTDADGAVTFHTIRPAGYALPDDGPVAQMMGLLGLPMRRPAHIQFRIVAAGFQTLITHVFDARDPQIDADPLFCVTPALVADFGDPASAETSTAQFTFKLARSRPGATPA